jgi:predicted dehydrogenase
MHGRRVLVIGAGRRATETILPALYCLQGSFEIVEVVARRERELSLLGGRLTLRVRATVEPRNVAAADTIIVAVPIREVPGVIRQLAAIGARHATLMLDTPVLHHRDLGATRHFEAFAEVLASEDAVALPPFVLARRLIDEGAIGRLRHVYLFHGGYRYHALASLRYLTGRKRPTRLRVTRWNRTSATWTARFPGGIAATVIEPLRHDAGRVLIVGDGGTIADYPLGQKAIEVRYLWRDGAYEGLAVGPDPVERSELDRMFVERLPAGDLADPSLNAQLKVRGFMELLASLEVGSSPFRYGALDALQDSLSIRLAERLRYLPDPRVGGGRTLLGQGIRTAAAVRRSTAHG